VLRTSGWPFALALSVSLAACGGRDADRLFPPIGEDDAGSLPDASTDDASVDAGSDALADASVDADEGGPDATVCETADDCPPPDEPCTLAVCASGACVKAYAPAGTEVPEEVQIPGDCKHLECGANGALVAITDVDDTPPDHDCYRTVCDGPNPRNENFPVGTVCAGNGVCNGNGQCGTCIPGAKGCQGQVPYLCDEQGKWQPGPACASECKAGDCVE